MTYVRSLGVSFAIFGLLCFSLPQTAGAATNACDFGNNIETLKTAQAANQGGDTASIVAELNIRKNLLRISLGCLKSEMSNLDEQLATIKNPSPEVKAFTAWLHQQVEENLSFYDYKGTQVDNLGLKGAKDFAKELADRKDQADSPLEDLVASTLDWTNSQTLFEAGQKRLIDIKKTLDAFDLPPDHEIIKLEKEALTTFNDASSENRNAWQALSSRQVDDARDKTRSSLEKLAKAYTIFLKISDISKKMLPL